MKRRERETALLKRLANLRIRHPNAELETELVEHDSTSGTAIFKATITVGRAGAKATAHASCSRERDGAYIDRAEALALIRAVRRLGYGTARPGALHTPRAADGPVPDSGKRSSEAPALPASVDELFSDEGIDGPNSAAEEIISPLTAKQLRQLTYYGAPAGALALSRYGRQLHELEIDQAEELLRELVFGSKHSGSLEG